MKYLGQIVKIKNLASLKFYKWLMLMIFIPLSGGFVTAQNTEKGFLLLKMGKINEAKNEFNLAITANKLNDIAMFGLGEVYFNLQKYDSAIMNFQSGTIANPNNAFNFIGLGKSLLAQKNTAKAELKFNIARKLGKKDANVYATIARAYIDGPNDYHDLASREIENAKKYNSKCSNIYLTEGLAFLKKNDVGNATTKFEQSIFFDSLNVEPYLQLADVYAATAVKQPAIDFLNNLIKKVPDCYIAYYKLGDIYYSMNTMNGYNEAKKNYDIYASKTNCSNEELEKYAYTLFFVKDYNKAMQMVNILSNNNPDNYIFLRLKSYMNFENKDYAKGLESFNAFFSNIPTSKILLQDYEYYAKTLSALNMDSLAVIAFQSAYSKDTAKLQYLDEMAKLSSKQRKYSDAIIYYCAILNKKSTPVPLDFFQLGKAYYMQAFKLKTDTVQKIDSLIWQKDIRAADSLFNNVCILQPASYLGFIWRARANVILDEESTKGLSKPYYEQALSILMQNPGKGNKELVEIYSYLGYHYFVINNRSESLNFWNKVIEIDPINEKALVAVKELTSHPK
jgi:predicted Zn-dependent protease